MKKLTAVCSAILAVAIWCGALYSGVVQAGECEDHGICQPDNIVISLTPSTRSPEIFIELLGGNGNDLGQPGDIIFYVNMKEVLRLKQGSVIIYDDEYTDTAKVYEMLSHILNYHYTKTGPHSKRELAQ